MAAFLTKCRSEARQATASEEPTLTRCYAAKSREPTVISVLSGGEEPDSRRVASIQPTLPAVTSAITCGAGHRALELVGMGQKASSDVFGIGERFTLKAICLTRLDQRAATNKARRSVTCTT